MMILLNVYDFKCLLFNSITLASFVKERIILSIWHFFLCMAISLAFEFSLNKENALANAFLTF